MRRRSKGKNQKTEDVNVSIVHIVRQMSLRKTHSLNGFVTHILFPVEAIEARSPSREDFIDAFQKCKYSFILLVSVTALRCFLLRVLYRTFPTSIKYSIPGRRLDRE